MQNNYWETVSSICCPECGHLLPDRIDACRFCTGPQAHDFGDLRSLDRIDSSILFDDEQYFDEISFDDGL